MFLHAHHLHAVKIHVHHLLAAVKNHVLQRLISLVQANVKKIAAKIKKTNKNIRMCVGVIL